MTLERNNLKHSLGVLHKRKTNYTIVCNLIPADFPKIIQTWIKMIKKCLPFAIDFDNIFYVYIHVCILNSMNMVTFRYTMVVLRKEYFLFYNYKHETLLKSLCL